MKNINRSERVSVRVRPDILEIANDLKKDYGYSMADIFEMGVLMIDNNQESELVVQDKILTEMITRFSNLEKSIKTRFDDIQSSISLQLDELKLEQENNKKNMQNVGMNQDVESIVADIVGMIHTREELLKNKRTPNLLDKTYFNYKSKISGVPVEIIIDSLEKEGYDLARLKELNMNPHIKIEEERVSEDQGYGTIW